MSAPSFGSWPGIRAVPLGAEVDEQLAHGVVGELPAGRAREDQPGPVGEASGGFEDLQSAVAEGHAMLVAGLCGAPERPRGRVDVDFAPGGAAELAAATMPVRTRNSKASLVTGDACDARTAATAAATSLCGRERWRFWRASWRGRAAAIAPLAGSSVRCPWAMAQRMMTEMRWRTRLAVSARSVQIGVTMPMTSAVVISSTGLWPIFG